MGITFFELQVKSGILIAISVLIYILLFSNDHFFNKNRAYLLSSILLPWVIPLIAMPIWLKELFWEAPEVVNIPIIPLADVNSIPLHLTIPVESSLSWEITGLYLYVGISFVILIRLLWAIRYIIRLKKQSVLKNFKGYKVAILTGTKTSPFSFFRTIYLPEKLEENIDKQLVLEHEKEHIIQWHSIDIILAELLLVFHWWNPFAWWLRKLIAQNHDYSVDRQILNKTPQVKQYQYSLINLLSDQNQVQLVNHFNKNLTKKRIIMMNQSNTNRRIAWLKRLLVFPFVLLLFLGFTNSDKTKYKLSKAKSSIEVSNLNEINPKNIIVSTEEDKLTAITTPISKINKKSVQEKKPLIKLITETKVQKKVKGIVSLKETQKPIEGVEIYNKYGELLATTNRKGKFSFHFVGNTKIPKEHQGEILFMKKGFQPQHYKLNMLSEKKTNIQLEMELKSTSANIENKHEVTGFLNNLLSSNNKGQPMFIIDGKVSTANTINSLYPNSIESISVLKGKTASAIYGNKGKGGVISVSLKKDLANNSGKLILSPIGKHNIKNSPLFIINGRESSKAEVDELDPNSVELMKVIKDKAIIEKYGEKGKDGVVIIKLKETTDK